MDPPTIIPLKFLDTKDKEGNLIFGQPPYLYFLDPPLLM